MITVVILYSHITYYRICKTHHGNTHSTKTNTPMSLL